MKKLLFATFLLISYNSFSQLHVTKFKANWYGTKEMFDNDLELDKVSILITMDTDNVLTIYTPDVQKYEIMVISTEEKDGENRQLCQGIDKNGNLCLIMLVYHENNEKGKFTFFIQYDDEVNDIYWWYWADIIG